MPSYRIFTNDRGSHRGVPMYSAFKQVRASNPETAVEIVPAQFNAPNCAPVKAIRWPASAQSDDEKKWLRKHVGEPL